MAVYSGYTGDVLLDPEKVQEFETWMDMDSFQLIEFADFTEALEDRPYSEVADMLEKKYERRTTGTN